MVVNKRCVKQSKSKSNDSGGQDVCENFESGDGSGQDV